MWHWMSGRRQRSGVEIDASARVVIVDFEVMAALLIARSSRSFVFLGRPRPSPAVFAIYLLPAVTVANTEQLPLSAPTEGGGRYVYSTNLLL
ncbi:hypothetical protein TNCV_1157471 [Trichonephila clavipes]|nr:hypothetical protein TNCV_1157471 [Trichonephila clavipes]